MKNCIYIYLGSLNWLYVGVYKQDGVFRADLTVDQGGKDLSKDDKDKLCHLERIAMGKTRDEVFSYFEKFERDINGNRR